MCTKHPYTSEFHILFFSLLCVLSPPYPVLYYFDFPRIFTPSCFSGTRCMSLGVSKLQIEIKLGCHKKVLGNREAVCLDCLITAIPSVSCLERSGSKRMTKKKVAFRTNIFKYVGPDTVRVDVCMCVSVRCSLYLFLFREVLSYSD